MKHIIWALEAKDSFHEIVNYLNENWTEKEYLNFETRINEVLSILMNHPSAYPLFNNEKNIRKAVIVKRISIFYQVSEDEITLLLFWNNSGDPVSLPL